MIYSHKHSRRLRPPADKFRCFVVIQELNSHCFSCFAVQNAQCRSYPSRSVNYFSSMVMTGSEEATRTQSVFDPELQVKCVPGSYAS
jgi:hypothetical protein